MTTPALVIHGVANRNRPAFIATVQDLNQRVRDAGGDYNLIPVYWGDIAEQSFVVNDILPETPAVRATGAAAEDSRMLALSLLGTPQPNAAVPTVTVRDSNQAQQIVADAATDESDAVRAGDPRQAQAMQDAIAEQWDQTENLKLIQDQQTLQQIGRAIGQSVQNAGDSSSGDSLVRGPLDDFKNLVKTVVTGVDKGIGAVVGNLGGALDATLRSQIGPGITEFLGDIIVYQHNRAAIQARIWEAIAQSAPGYGVEGKPIIMIAHSLGTVISFDTAVSGTPQLHIDRLITFGGQPSWFYVLSPDDGGLPKYQLGQPTQLPPTINRWTNLWEPLDFLAFLQGRVFKLSSGNPPNDIGLSHLNSAGLFTHSAYWSRSELVDAIVRE